MQRLKLGDIILLIFILIAAGIFFVLKIENKNNLTKQDKKIVIKYLDNELITEFSKNKKEIKVKGKRGYSIIEIGSNWVRMKESACPSKFCVKRGKIFKPGESIICLPNQVLITIKEEKNIKKRVDSICH